MSIRVMTAVWDNGPTKQGHLLVMLALADYSNDQFECWPSMKSIAAKARMTERGVQKILRTLEDEGWLFIQTGNGRHGCNQYRINASRLTPNVDHPERGSPRTSMQKTPNVDAETPNGGSPEPSRTIKEPSLEDNAPARKVRLPEGWVPDDEDIQYALSQKLTHDEIKEIADDFHAYWRDRTDAGGRKSVRGWKQTWKNRCRDQAPKFVRNRGMAGGPFTGRHGQGGGIAGVVTRRQFGS